MKVLATVLALLLPVAALAATAFDIASIEGSYSTSFPNGDVQGHEWTGHNKLDIEKKSRTSAHVLLITEGYNGSDCGLDDMMTLEGRRLIYREIIDGDQCFLTIEKVGSKIVVDDENLVCRRMYCGARAGFDVDFPVK